MGTSPWPATPPTGTWIPPSAQGGAVVTSFTLSGRSDFAHALAIDSSSNLVVAGTSNASGSDDFAVARYQSSGPCTAPTIIDPASQTLSGGSTATLGVAAIGTPPLSFQWYQGSSWDTSAPVGTNSPTFTTAPLIGTTSYWVRVTNACGTVDSGTASITVLLADLTIDPGWTAVLRGKSLLVDNLRVRNTGAGTAGPFTLSLFVVRDLSAVSLGDRALGSFPVAGLGPGDVTATMSLRYRGSAKDLGRFVLVAADSFRAVPESNEANNLATQRIRR